MTENKKILIGKIVAPQGIRGEVRVQSFAENTRDWQNLCVFADKIMADDFHFVRTVPNTNVIIAKINGINDRNGAETLRGTELFIDRDTLPQLDDENEFYQADLIGFDVVRDNKNIGKVACFQNYGAGDIIELNNGDMVSFVGASVDMQSQIIYVR